MSLEFRVGDLEHPAVIALLRSHLAGVAQISPPESIHALDDSGLGAPDVTFWSAWREGELAGVGALKELSPEHGEIKSMKTDDRFLRRGIGRAILRHLIAVARERGYLRLSLETGSQDGFTAARALYARFGFVSCPPFADYVDDPNSAFMTLLLD